MRHADAMLTEFGVPHECQVVSAHRTPALDGRVRRRRPSRGLEVIIAGAGGAAHLPGMVAAQTVAAGDRRAGAERGAERPRLAAVDRADAEGRAGGDGRHRRGRRRQRRAARGRHSRHARGPSCATQAARRYRDEHCGRASRADATSLAMHDLQRRNPHPILPGCHHRRARRRPARPHVRDRRAPPRLPRPHALARARHADRPGRRRRDRRVVRRPRRGPRVRQRRRRRHVRVRERARRRPRPRPKRTRSSGRTAARCTIAQHRVREKTFLAEHGLPVDAVRARSRRDDDLQAALEQRRLPGGAQDRGVRLRRQGAGRDRRRRDDLAAAWDTLGRQRGDPRSVRRSSSARSRWSARAASTASGRTTRRSRTRTANHILDVSVAPARRAADTSRAGRRRHARA